MNAIAETSLPEKPQLGIYSNITNHDYHSGPGISKSQMDWALKLARLYEYYSIDENVQKETAVFREGKILHKIVLEFDDFESEFSVTPKIPDECIGGGSESLKSEIEKYNLSLPEKPSADDLIALIAEFNASLKQPIGMGSSISETEANYLQLPAEFQKIAEGEKRTAAAFKARIKEYNATLPEQLKTTGSYSALLDNVAKITDPEAASIAEKVRQMPEPFPLSGKIEEMKERIRSFKPGVVFADEWLDAWKEEQFSQGKDILTEDEYTHALRIRDAVLAHPEAAILLTTGKSEVSCYWNHEETGELLKCRFDWLDEENALAPDLKFLRDVSRPAFERDGGGHNYHIQHAHYADGYYQLTGKHISMPFICVEKDAPLGKEAFKPILVAVHYWRQQDVDRGLKLRDYVIRQIVKWRNDGYYPGYDGINEASIPQYQVAREEALLKGEAFDDQSKPEPDEQQVELPESIFF
ncbi:PD-(D/E)XK nuclease-like domain-containing protein [uncultured Tolumonas sp.]|uniref:PD-(D/E)XK nuclease-like domain-containing protein n=1 Tax=uncultured Tolumonas sp. TaxID=263765 RepID=UPI002A0A6FED|nr:PD-(D/E)XK nuclease-like domain-containing protein [uncultured Tolumonas sp.]